MIPFGFLISLYFLGLINFVRAGNLGATVLTTSAVTVSTEVYLIVKIASLATDLVASNRIVVSLPDDGWYFDNAGTSACSLTYNGEDVSVSAFASSLTVIDIQLDADITDDSNLETQIICTHVLTPSNAVAARSDVNVETRTSLASGDTLIDSAVSTGTLNGIHGSAHVTASRAVSESELNNLATSLYLDISISDDNLEDPFTEAIATDIIQSLSGSIGTGAWNEITFSTPSFLNYVSRVSTTQVRKIRPVGCMYCSSFYLL